MCNYICSKECHLLLDDLFLVLCTITNLMIHEFACVYSIHFSMSLPILVLFLFDYSHASVSEVVLYCVETSFNWFCYIIIHLWEAYLTQRLLTINWLITVCWFGNPWISSVNIYISVLRILLPKFCYFLTVILGKLYICFFNFKMRLIYLL